MHDLETLAVQMAELKTMVGIQHAIGRFAEAGYRDPSLLLEGWTPVGEEAPAWLGSVFERYDISEEQVQDLTEAILTLGTESYLTGINEELIEASEQTWSSIENDAINVALRDRAEESAHGIAATYRRRLRNQVFAEWAGGQHATQADLDKAIGSWAETQLDHMADQISIETATDFYGQAITQPEE